MSAQLKFAVIYLDSIASNCLINMNTAQKPNSTFGWVVACQYFQLIKQATRPNSQAGDQN